MVIFNGYCQSYLYQYDYDKCNTFCILPVKYSNIVTYDDTTLKASLSWQTMSPKNWLQIDNKNHFQTESSVLGTFLVIYWTWPIEHVTVNYPLSWMIGAVKLFPASIILSPLMFVHEVRLTRNIWSQVILVNRELT